MPFLFNFQQEEAVESVKLESTKEEHAAPATRINLCDAFSNDGLLPVIGESVTVSNTLTLYKRHMSDIKFQIAASQDTEQQKVSVNDGLDFSKVMEQNSDLVKGVYEGGLKTWECAYPLSRFLDEKYKDQDLSGLRVLELGCGSSLPGLTMLSKNAHVTFQDYNQDVIKTVTIPNVLLNQSQVLKEDMDRNGLFDAELDLSVFEQQLAPQAEFYSGDWQSFVEYFGTMKPFDLILTSETLYESTSIPKLYNLLKSCIDKDHGEIYVAAKTNYFGCSGSLAQFKQIVHADGVFDMVTVEYVNENVGHEIVQLTFKRE